jgi:hypothetical protein
LLAWRNTGFCTPGDDADQSRCLVPDKVRRGDQHATRSPVFATEANWTWLYLMPTFCAAQQSRRTWLQDDEMIVSMVSTHHGAQTSETAEQAASAIELLSVVYRMYVLRLSEVCTPKWGAVQTLPHPDDLHACGIGSVAEHVL